MDGQLPYNLLTLLDSFQELLFKVEVKLFDAPIELELVIWLTLHKKRHEINLDIFSTFLTFLWRDIER